ncbi:MAG: hypothetical protein BYD32DRAFT_478323 [Podila humilis]|nr:MAG: hypothetical protein BYD32DRAFT_478323 [Podila humilis]
MTDTLMRLFSLVDEEATSNAFPVEIEPSKTVGHLKDLIKAKKTNNFHDVDADDLTLWRVSIPVVPANKHTPIVLNGFESSTELDPTDDVSDIFVEQPLKTNDSHHCPATTSRRPSC